jgi:hypothetical protein
VPDLVAYYTDQRQYARMMRALVERAWRPQSWAGRAKLARMRKEQQQSNELCTCTAGVPSMFCRAHACWAFEIGACDGLRPSDVGRVEPSDRVRCDCMRHAWGPDPEQRWPHHRLSRVQLIDPEDTPGLHFNWLDPQPGGKYGPGFCPRAAARKLTTRDVHLWESEDHTPLRNFPSYGKL